MATRLAIRLALLAASRRTRGVLLLLAGTALM